MRKYFKIALENIAKHGDTDVLPFPIDNHIFFDKGKEALDLLMRIHEDFGRFVDEYTPINEKSMVAVGYTGFRGATQIDPVWNAYLLGLVVAIGNDIEKKRISVEKQTVFSYRFKCDEDKKTLFDTDVGWRQFQETSVGRAEEFEYVLICDISDFYPRISLHRLENALSEATQQTQIVTRIMRLLSRISGRVSYGLPVGGPAARLLSELLLDRVDRLLLTNGVTFCRYADDYHIFARTKEEAYRSLVFLSEKLLKNEGLSLQKSKTRIMSHAEFKSFSEHAVTAEPQEPIEAETKSFLSLRIHFDPYSPTKEEDYRKLKAELSAFDIPGMLTREIGKSRIHQPLMKRLISAVRHIEPSARNDAVYSLIDNLHKLYPVFPNVIVLIKKILQDIDDEIKSCIFQKVRDLISSRSYIIMVPTNMGYAVRALADDDSEEAEELLVGLYKDTDMTNMMIRRDIILIMAKRLAGYWISDLKNNFGNLNAWEKRSIIIASFILGDGGKHFRYTIKGLLSPIDELSLSWAQEKSRSKDWRIPI